MLFVAVRLKEFLLLSKMETKITISARVEKILVQKKRSGNSFEGFARWILCLYKFIWLSNFVIASSFRHPILYYYKNCGQTINFIILWPYILNIFNEDVFWNPWQQPPPLYSFAIIRRLDKTKKKNYEHRLRNAN